MITGFLLTAIPNWTGRLPIQGLPLAALTVLWIAGRVAISVSGLIGWLPAALIDVAFLSAMVAFIVREIVIGKNWRNLRVAAVVAVFAAGNIAYHIEAFLLGGADYSVRLGLGTAVLLLALIGGRIIPSFTHNWLARFNPGQMPASFGRFDGGTILTTVAALATFVVAPHSIAVGFTFIVAGVLHGARLARWVGYRTAREPLVLILHVGYAFVPLGFFLLGLAVFDLAPQSAGIHAWTIGAVGVMTLAVMTRASLGHTGQELTASLVTRLIYLCAIVAGFARIGAALLAPLSLSLLQLSVLAWSLAFLGFAAAYGPLLCRPRPSAEAHAQ